MKIIVLIALLIAFVYGGTVTNGNGVTRSISVVQGPPAEPHTFELRATRTNANKKLTDAVDFLFSTNWVPRFVFRYFQKDADTAQLFATRWALWKLIEYNENGTSDGFVPGSGDILLQNYYLWLRLDWSELAYSLDVTPEGINVHSVCTSQPALNPVVTLCARLASKPIFYNGTNLSPNRIKWGLNVTSNFPYTSATSRLALKVSWDTLTVIADFDSSQNQTQQSENPGTAGIVLSDTAGYVGVATYVTQVNENCGGTVSKVDVFRTVIYQGSTQPENETLPLGDPDVDIDLSLRVSYFSFLTDCAYPSISWDPEMGASNVFLPSVLLLAIALFALMF